jgi:DNA repair ATPase RecN
MCDSRELEDAMGMESLLKKLEARIEDLVEVYEAEKARVAELEERYAELERELESATQGEGRLHELEAQRDQLAERLQKVLELIDETLDRSQA